jgi:hypothetical protein
LANHEEIETMDMDMMVVCVDNVGVLKNQLNNCVEGKDFHSRPIHRLCIIGWSASVIKWEWRIIWKIVLAYSFHLLEIVGLKKSSAWEKK